MVSRTLDTRLPFATYPGAEPPPMQEWRLVCESAMAEVNRAFINASVQASTIGFKELDNGQFITLEELELQINQAK